MPRAEAFGFGNVGFDVFELGGLVTPGVVDEEFGVDAKKLIQKFDISKRTACNVTHSIHTATHKALFVATPHTPNISDGLMFPKLFTKTDCVEAGDANASRVWFGMLGKYIHGDFGEEEISTDPSGGGNASLLIN